MTNETDEQHEKMHEALGREITDAILEIGRKHNAPYTCLMKELEDITLTMHQVYIEEKQQQTSNN